MKHSQRKEEAMMNIFGNSRFKDFSARLQRFGDAIEDGPGLMQPPIKPGNRLNRWGHGLMAMGAGFQGQDASAYVEDYKSGLERARQQEAIAQLVGLPGIGGAAPTQPTRLGLNDHPARHLAQFGRTGLSPFHSRLSEGRWR